MILDKLERILKPALMGLYWRRPADAEGRWSAGYRQFGRAWLLRRVG